MQYFNISELKYQINQTGFEQRHSFLVPHENKRKSPPDAPVTFRILPKAPGTKLHSSQLPRLLLSRYSFLSKLPSTVPAGNLSALQEPPAVRGVLGTV